MFGSDRTCECNSVPPHRLIRRAYGKTGECLLLKRSLSTFIPATTIRILQSYAFHAGLPAGSGEEIMEGEVGIIRSSSWSPSENRIELAMESKFSG